jgi:hypothetical protein
MRTGMRYEDGGPGCWSLNSSTTYVSKAEK